MVIAIEECLDIYFLKCKARGDVQLEEKIDLFNDHF